jgi:hypothetical protein
MSPSNQNSPLQILLEADTPYMVPANFYNSIPDPKGKRLSRSFIPTPFLILKSSKAPRIPRL